MVNTNKGRKTKRSEPRDKTLNIRATATEILTLNSVVRERKKSNKSVSQADVIFGGIEAGAVINRLYNLRQILATEQIDLQSKYKAWEKSEEPRTDVDFLYGQLSMIEKIVFKIDQTLTTK